MGSTGGNLGFKPEGWRGEEEHGRGKLVYGVEARLNGGKWEGRKT